jgi:hypothetical protein
MTTIAPNKVVLTCNVTGKTVTWTNKKIIQQKIDKYGSLETFMSKYTSKGSKKKNKTEKVGVTLKPILQEGVKMGKMSPEEYTTKYVQKRYEYKDGTSCTVVVPEPVVASNLVV